MERMRVHEPPAYAGLVDEEGNFDRPMRADPWDAPGDTIRLREGHLECELLGYLSTRLVTPRPPMLEQFIRLSGPSRNQGQAVLRYATRWGLLELCQHQLPMSHEGVDLPLCFAVSGGRITAAIQPSDECRSVRGKEPIATWLYWSRQAAAVLAVVGRLRDGQYARPADWSALAEEAPWMLSLSGVVDDQDRDLIRHWTDRLVAGLDGPDPSGHDYRRDEEQRIARAAIETWLRLGGPSFELRWPAHGDPEVGFKVSGLFGALGVQLLLVAASSRGFAICPGCGLLHAPHNGRGRPPLYCQSCRARHVPQQRADERRERKQSRRECLASPEAAAG